MTNTAYLTTAFDELVTIRLHYDGWFPDQVKVISGVKCIYHTDTNSTIFVQKNGTWNIYPNEHFNRYEVVES